MRTTAWEVAKGGLSTAEKGRIWGRKKKTSTSATTRITLILWDIMFCFNSAPDK